ncbi:MAG: hypothetical protein AAF633_18570 [Chloroflexota bacterium]
MQNSVNNCLKGVTAGQQFLLPLSQVFNKIPVFNGIAESGRKGSHEIDVEVREIPVNLVKGGNRLVAVNHGTIVEDGPTTEILKAPKTETVKGTIGAERVVPELVYDLNHTALDEAEAAARFAESKRS